MRFFSWIGAIVSVVVLGTLASFGSDWMYAADIWFVGSPLEVISLGLFIALVLLVVTPIWLLVTRRTISGDWLRIIGWAFNITAALLWVLAAVSYGTAAWALGGILALIGAVAVLPIGIVVVALMESAGFLTIFLMGSACFTLAFFLTKEREPA